MTTLQQFKLKHYQTAYGIMTADEALVLAIEAEDMCKVLGPYDPAWTYFCQQKIDFEKYAYLISEN